MVTRLRYVISIGSIKDYLLTVTRRVTKTNTDARGKKMISKNKKRKLSFEI